MTIRKTVQMMQAYAWEASSASIAQRFGIREADIVRFDTNTSPFALEAVQTAAEKTAELPNNEYPAPDYKELLDAISAYLDVEAGQLVVGAGGDEVIDTLAKAFLESGRKCAISTPTYSMFGVASRSYGAGVVEVPRGPQYALDVETLADGAEGAELLWVCNPNSPTGNAEPLEKIRALAESTKATVVVDEAYAEFGGESAVALTKQYDNLVVIRTLSKAFGLAGARVGYAVANEKLAADLNKLRLPNSISYASARMAFAALGAEGIAQMRRNVQTIAQERERVKAALSSRFRVFPSTANFLLIDCRNADAGRVFEEFLSKGLVVRNLSQKPLTRNCLRITIRTRVENDRLLEALA